MFPFSYISGKADNPSTNYKGNFELVTFDKDPINVFSAQVRRCETHWHSAPELILVAAGKFNVIVNGESYHIESGGYIFIGSGDIHGLTAIKPDSKLLTLQLSQDLFKFYNKEIGLCLKNRKDNDNEVVYAAMDIVKDVISEYEFHSFKRLSLIYQLLDIIERSPSEKPERSQYVRKKDEKLIKNSLSYIDENYMNTFSLADLAEVSGLSYSYFSRTFKKVCGQKFKDYLTLVRVSKAVSLLCDTSIPITEISHLCGFGEHKYLIAGFKKLHGMTPTEFRKKFHAGYGGEYATPDVVAIPLEKTLSLFC